MSKEVIVSCRENGSIAETEDRSGLWIQEKYIPKFEIFKNGNLYGFSLRVFEEDAILHSKMFDKIGCCLNLLEKVKANVGATDVYMSVEKIHGDYYKKWGLVEEEPVVEEIVEEAPIEEEPVVDEVVDEAPIEEEPVVEEIVEEEPIEEESVIPKKCIVGVIWPESNNPEKIYRYKVPEGSANVGDIVTAPTFDTYRKKDVIRKARVTSVEYYEEGENIVLPTKSIISLEKN